MPLSHHADVESMVSHALASGQRPSLDDADLEAPSVGTGWIDRIEAAIGSADSTLLDALDEIRRLDRVLRSKTQKLARVRRRGRLQAMGAHAEAAEDEPSAAALHVAPAADTAERPRSRASDDELRELCEPLSAVTLPRAEPSELAARGRRDGAETPPSTAGSALLGPFLTGTTLLNDNDSGGGGGGGGGRVAEQGALALATAHDGQSSARGGEVGDESPGGGGYLGGLTARGMLAQAEAELRAEGEAAHNTLFAQLGIPELGGDAPLEGGDDDVRPESPSEVARRLDPRIVRLTAAESARLALLEAMAAEELCAPLVPLPQRLRLDAISAELEARFVRPASAHPALASPAERAAAALEAVAPVIRRTEPLVTAADGGKLFTAQGFKDYAREQRVAHEARAALAALDARLHALYHRPEQGNTLGTRPVSSVAPLDDNEARASVEPRETPDMSDAERTQLARLLATVHELGQAEIATRGAGGPAVGENCTTRAPSAAAAARERSAAASGAQLSYDYLSVEAEKAHNRVDVLGAGVDEQ